MTAFTGASSATVAGAYGQALGALTYTWDGAATPTLTSPSGAGGNTITGQALAGITGIPESLQNAAQAAGKNSYAVSPG